MARWIRIIFNGEMVAARVLQAVVEFAHDYQRSLRRR